MLTNEKQEEQEKQEKQEKQAQAITVERDVEAAADEVYRAFTNELALQYWLCNSADVEARKGGRIYLWWDKGYYSSGVYTDLERDKMVAFTWRGPDDPEATEVRVSIAPHDDNGTHVTLTHSGPGPGQEWAEAAFRDRRGWESALDSLQAMLERGIDLRMSRRPMFGLNGFGDLNDELTARLVGVPVTEGLWVGGVFDGMGAKEAGLQRDDVLVSMAGQLITGFASFGNIIQSYHAGDKVEVGYYRGAEHHTATVHLSERPTPDVPATHDALVEWLHATYRELDAELEAALQGVTEEEAEYRGAPDEWNVKEILAHLITVEQGTQSQIYAAIDDTDINAPFFSNEPGRIRAVASTYGTIAASVEQLKLAEAITMAQVATMPAAVQAHKHVYNPVVVSLTTLQDHNRAHLAEIAACIRAARSQGN